MSGAAGDVSPEPGQTTLLTDYASYGRNFWFLFGATFALNFSANLFVLYPLQLVDFGATSTAIGAIVGVWSLASLLARPAAGPLIDRIGRRNTATRLLALDVLVILLYMPIRAIGWHVYAVRAMHGAIEGTARVALFALLYDLLPKGREGRAMATFSLCGMAPAAIAPYCGEVLIHRFGFNAFFAAVLLVTAASAYLVSVIPADPPMHHGPQPAPANAKTYPQLLFDSRLMPLWIVTLLFALAISPRLSFVAPFAYERGIGRVWTYFAVYSVIGMAVRILTGRMMDSFGLERTLGPSMTVLGIGIALIAGTGRYDMLDIAGVVGGLGHGYLYPALSAMVIARTEIGATGRSAGIYQSLYDIGAMVGPYGLGAVAGALGYAPMFAISGALALAGAIYFIAADPDAHSWWQA
jgi:MFS family permease